MRQKWGGLKNDQSARALGGGQRQRGSNPNSGQGVSHKRLAVEDKTVPVTQRAHFGAMTQHPVQKQAGERPGVASRNRGSSARRAGRVSSEECPPTPAYELLTGLASQGCHVIDLSLGQGKQAGSRSFPAVG